MRADDQSGFTVVIGGGGAVAIGIGVGLMMALAEVGIDVRQAETTIGTSAGATVAADLRLDLTLDEIVARVCSDCDGDDAEFQLSRAWRSWPELGRRVIGSTWVVTRALSPVRVPLPTPSAALQRRFPGTLMSLGESQDWATELYPQEWPEGRVWAVAADIDAHRRVVLTAEPTDDAPRATLPQALRAACAIPGLYPPVRVGDARLVDGGFRSVSNLDLAARLPQRAVLGISAFAFDSGDPPSGLGRTMRTMPQRALLREAALLRRRGHEVLLMAPGRTAIELAGTRALAGRITSDVVEAAYEGAAQRLAAPDMQRRVERFLAAADGTPVAA